LDYLAHVVILYADRHEHVFEHNLC
jgi:hypothetical protein